MKFKPETFGKLVRPRILAMACVLPSTHTTTSADFPWTSPRKKSDRFNNLSIFKQKPRELFSTLELGNTSQDLGSAYTAEVTHYIVKIASTITLVDRNNVHDTLKRARNRLGARTNLRVISVGVKFYHGMKKDQIDGSLIPVNPWNPKMEDGQDTIWFYSPWELVPIEEIIKYESVAKGDLILFQKCKGLVVKKKLLNKPKFYSTSSWSCYSITLLNHTADGFTRFLPDRNFQVRNPRSHED